MKRLLSIAVAATLLSASAIASATVLTNGSFETNNVGGGYAYGSDVVASGWTFSRSANGGSGVSTSNYIAWVASGSSTSSGEYFAFLQGTSSITQLFSVTAASLYDVSFALDQRSGYDVGQTVAVAIDGILLGTYTPTTDWSSIISASTLLGIGSHTLTLTGLYSGNADTTALVDNVAVNAVPEPGSIALLLGGLGIMGAVARRRQAKQG